jgi:hypothetical protein
MSVNPTQPLQADSQEIQNMIGQVMAEATKSLPKPQVPSWMETWIEFIKVHPWTALLVALLVMVIIFAVIREMICVYLKTNEILARLKKIEERLE